MAEAGRYLAEEKSTLLNKVLGAADLDLTSFGLSFADTLSSSAGKMNRKYRV